MICIGKNSCGKDKSKENFRSQRHTCKSCESKNAIIWRKENSDKYNNIENKFKEKNPDYKRNWKNNNREHILEYNRKYESIPQIKLAKSMRRAINRCLNANRKLKYLLYTIKELKQHLELQFEQWMTWKNHGVYNKKTWNDNDPSTWKWQIDHIIPKSDFTYFSMEDEEFKKCWALSNLRPLSAKQNIIDGAQRIRHKNKKAA